VIRHGHGEYVRQKRAVFFVKKRKELDRKFFLSICHSDLIRLVNVIFDVGYIWLEISRK